MIDEELYIEIRDFPKGGKRVSLIKGTGVIALDIVGDRVHVWATSKGGGWTVATLRFLKDGVIEEE